MEFTATKEDHNVEEFYKKFGQTLPKIVMVNQGFCGEIVSDTFAREQILRIHAVSRQKRVVARAGLGSHRKLYSIPLNYQAPLCVVTKRGKAGQEQYLSDIVKEHRLPVTVQFPKNHSISVGGQTICANHIPAMELTQIFDEMYLLGNFIADGVLSQETVNVPLYLSQLRLSIVTGIKGQSEEAWNSYIAELARSSFYIKYDLEFGNNEIAVYHQHAFHADKGYSYVQPVQYGNIVNVFPPGEQDTTSYDLDTTPTETQLSSESQYENNMPVRTATPVENVDITWEFITEQKDYNAAEFYERFGRSLPKVAMINQGFYREEEDAFDRGQFFRFHAVSRQRRVLAKSNIAKQKNLFSVPLNYPEKLCVVSKNGKVESEQTLQQIMKAHNLPIRVQFPKGHTVNIGYETNNSNNQIPVMELTQTFDETNLLGNFIIDGVLARNVVRVPLFLSQVRFCLVTGLKNRKWEMYLKEIERACATIKYGQEFGHPEIAVYQPGLTHSDVEYAYVEPTLYTNFINIFKRGGIDITQSHTHVAEPLTTQESTTRNTLASTIPDRDINQTNDIIPEREELVNPMTREPNSSKSEQDQSAVREPEQPVKQKNSEDGQSNHRELPTLRNGDDVAKLTISEVSEYLNILNLGQYASQFKEEMVDGSTLQHYDKDILKEFGFKGSEAIRLLRFAQEGYVPK